MSRPKEKTEYVEAFQELVGDLHPELNSALHKMKTHHLLMLAKAISDRQNVSMPNFPTSTETQKLRLKGILEGLTNGSDTIPTDTSQDN